LTLQIVEVDHPGIRKQHRLYDRAALERLGAHVERERAIRLACRVSTGGLGAIGEIGAVPEHPNPGIVVAARVAIHHLRG
jgi:hypothetical protein